MLEELLEIIHNNDTAKVKAHSFLKIVAREKSRLNDKKENDDLSFWAIELDNEGMNKCH